MAAGDRAKRVPPQPQSPPKLGLVPSSLHPTPGSLGFDTNSRWQFGIKVREETCIGSVDVPGGYTWNGCTSDVSEPASGLDFDARNDYKTWLPVTIVDGDQCSAEGWNVDSQEDIDAQALRILVANVPRKIELELWTGRVANAAGFPNDWLANPATADDLGDVPLAFSLSELVQYLADTIPGRGMIHAQPRLVSLWDQLHLIRREGNLLLENTADHIIVPGTGYTGAGLDDPDNPGEESGVPASVDTSAAYATGMVSLIQGDPTARGSTLGDNLSTRDNTITWFGTEAYLAWFGDCAHGAIQVNHTNPCGNIS